METWMDMMNLGVKLVQRQVMGCSKWVYEERGFEFVPAVMAFLRAYLEVRNLEDG